MVARALEADVSFQVTDFSTTPHWEEEAGGADLVFAMSVLHWVHDKERLLRFLSRQRELVYEGHDTLEYEQALLRRLGFTTISIISETERGRYLLYARRLAGDSGDKRDVGALRELLVCPTCRSELVWSHDAARCAACAHDYPVIDGVPVLFGSALDGDRSKPSEDAKSRQASFFNELDESFEIERPMGTTWLYEWMLRWKFSQATRDLSQHMKGARAVAMCGGSGMDAEFLTRAGASVISVDISIGAARRARTRAQRHGVEYLSVAADAEQLPLADRSVDVSYVHDGLHHLARPDAGLSEMTRVSRHAVAITEPADAALTRVAVRHGYALDTEKGGNRVQRLSVAKLSTALAGNGFRIVSARRYALLYRHEPGPVSRLFSLPAFRTVAKVALLAGNAVIGRWGNKLAVQAVRRDS
jgi:SAM-dependent methyltransferase